MPTWSDLPPEILHSIAGKLEFYEDFINFLCVCRSWKSSTNFNQQLPSRFPCLILTEYSKTEEDSLLFLLSRRGTTRKLYLPEARGQRCIPVHGWLITTGEAEFSAKLLHPLTRLELNLPELYMFEELYFDQDEWMYYGHSMKKAVFTSPNPLDPSCQVVIIWGRTLGVCRPSDTSWARIKGWEGDVYDITYHTTQQRLYAVASFGTVYECDVVGSESLRRVSNDQLCSWCRLDRSAYVIEWGHEGLLVVTHEREYYKKGDDMFGRCGAYRTKGFRAFVLCLDDGKWSEVESLGDRAVFVGFNSSFAVDAYGDVKRDCVYFTDDIVGCPLVVDEMSGFIICRKKALNPSSIHS